MLTSALRIFIIYCFFVLTHYRAELCHRINWFEDFSKQLAAEETPYLISVFINDDATTNGTQWEFMLKGISAVFPIVLINVTDLPNGTSLSKTVNVNPRSVHVPFLIILTNENYLQKLKNIFQVIADPAFVPPRPKCILVYFGFVSKTDVKDFFEYIWTLQFLEVFILKMNRNDDASDNPFTTSQQDMRAVDPLKISYNPFTKVMNEEQLSSESQLFPDKVNDVHGYPLKIPVYNDPPYLTVMKNKNRDVIAVGGKYHKYFEPFFQTINSSVHYIYFHATTYKEKNTVFLLLENNIINAMTIPNIIGAFNKGNLIRSRPFATTKFVIVVPYLTNSEMHVPLSALIVLFIFPVIVISFTIIARILKFPRKTWDSIKIFQVLVGVALHQQPRKFTERVVLLALISLSMEYTTDFVAKLTGIKFLKTELSYDSFEDLYESQLPIYAGDFFTESFCKNFDNSIKKVLARAKKVKNIYECYYANLNNKPSICVAFHMQAITAVEKFRGADGEPIMKMTGLSLLEDFKAFPFEKASPFARKFDVILQRLVEAGIPNTWDYFRKNITFQKRKKDGTNKTGFAMQLAVLLGAGLLMSITAFMVEFICRYVKRTRIIY